MWNLLPILMILVLPGQQAAPDLATVIQRATNYVTQYEAELGNLIGTEDYLQNVAHKNIMAGRIGTISGREQRRLSSDFLIIQVGSQWQALRKTNRLNGSKVKESQPEFETAFDDSPAANTKRFTQMKADSTMYNIGDVRREINLPTFALEALRKSEVSRFRFERSGTTKLDGIPVWEVHFQELTGWTLVHGRPDQELFSRGTFWIEPDTGRVLKTEFIVENDFEQSPIKARIVVTYKPAKTLPLLVPDLMLEHYDSQYDSIDCRADYSNFRRFEVDVKFDLALPKPPGHQ